MKELKIYEYQAKQIEDTLRLDRDIIQSHEFIKNVLQGEPDKAVTR